MSIATKTGDNGTTALMFGRRVPKTHARVRAYGAVDELNAALGMGRAHCPDAALAATVLDIQKELVTLMGELATDPADRDRYLAAGYQVVGPAMVDRLTGLIEALEQGEKISYKGWATPGGTPAAAGFDLARTICRRAEREVIALDEVAAEHPGPLGPVNTEIRRYLNRLSDLCWLWARKLETAAGI